MASGKEIEAHSARNQKKDEARDLKQAPGDKNKAAKSNRAKRHEFKLGPGESSTTTDHDTIRHWVEARGGKPAVVRATEGKNDAGLLRIDFPGRRGENRLEEISWEDFFEKFEQKRLAFLYQEQTKTGRVSRFSKFVSRDGKK